MNPAVVRLFFAVSMMVVCNGCAPGGPEARLTVQVVDDDGKPIVDAAVAVLGFVRESAGKTDRNGCFTATLRNAKSAVDIVVEKKGYYSVSRHIFEFTGGYRKDRWEPWNPTLDFLLAKKRNPVILITREERGLKIPVRDQPVGYDLVVGDWVAPAGKGLVSDFIMVAQTTITNENVTSNRLVLTFSNVSDGLIQSNIHWRNDYTLRLPPIAPDVGYSNKWEFYLNENKDPKSGIIHAQANWSKDDNYYFRVRSKLDAGGRIESAIYGKIYRGILYHPRSSGPKAAITFEYYLNPDGTRNLESKGERPDDP